MKKLLFSFLLFLISTFLIVGVILSTFGIETKKFNNFISAKINQNNSDINVKLNTIKFKLDVNEISLFLETNNPNINYRETLVPATNIKVYMDFISLIKNDPKIKKINIIFNQLDISQLKKISKELKPSNTRSLIKNKLSKGILDAELEIFLDKDNLLDNFIAKGKVKKFKANIADNFKLENASFNFFADKSDVLISNFVGEIGHLKLTKGDLKFKISSEISIESNFQAILVYQNDKTNRNKLIEKINIFENISNLNIDSNNNLKLTFDKTYKVKKYNFFSKGKIKNANLEFKNSLKNYLSNEIIEKINLVETDFKFNISQKKNIAELIGKYSFSDSNYQKFNLKNNSNNDSLNLKLNIDYNKIIEIKHINYFKPKNIVANIFVDFNKQKNKVKFEKIKLQQEKNLILFEGLEFNKGKFLSLRKISALTFKDGLKNNDFTINYGKKIKIKGNQFDASNLPKIIKNNSDGNEFLDINKEIEIDFSNIIAPLSEKISNFKLIGKVEKGKFVKISSKGEFGNNNYLDISMKNDSKSKKKYLEIYSDITKPLLTEFSFFKGLTGGKLIYSSIIDKNSSNSKLKIENFKVVNAPGMVKLLSLADLGGLADLAEGEGLSFDVLEIKMEKNKNILKLNEIIALGPSISVLMEGYQDSAVTSLRGTLVPAKTLNKMISKIPVIGDIVIPKDLGEGLFGISFKLKGPTGNIKTTINPIRTLTPRFIQKIIEKRNVSK